MYAVERSLALLGLWFTIGVVASFASAVLVGVLFGSATFLADFNRDEMAEFDAKLDGKKSMQRSMMKRRGDAEQICGVVDTLYWAVTLVVPW